MAPRQGNPDQIQEIRLLLRRAGLRSTPARIAVMVELQAARKPMTHADLANMLVPRGFDKATVFRNLADLAEAELVRRTELGDHVWRFELRDPDDHADGHPHFVCVDCGAVSCLGEMEFTAASRRRSEEIGRITEILIKGHCTSCEDHTRAVDQ